MNLSEQIQEMIYKSLDGVNEMLGPDQALAKAPDTVLIGEGSNLDSLGFVNLGATLVDLLERAFKKPFDLTDILAAAEDNPCTIASMAKNLASPLEDAAEVTSRA